jgi:DNA (cytosine-5)-methyltransferase 1
VTFSKFPKNMTDYSPPRAILPLSASAVDLFCGAGGLTHGLLAAGLPVKAGYDLDASCKFPYEHNNAGASFHECSVTKLTGSKLLQHYPEGHTRILVGCAPCQTFSKYTRGVDKRGDLKWVLLNEFARLIREAKPEIVSMENVPLLREYRVFTDFLATLSDEGFHFTEDAKKQVIYCPDYGIPQNRERLVIIASRLGAIKLLPPTHKGKHKHVKTAIQSLPILSAGDVDPDDPLHRCSRLSPLNLRRIQHSEPGGTWREWPPELVADCHKEDTGRTYPSVYGRMRWDKPSPTITTQFFGFGNGRFGHPEQDRALSLREGALLQSFPQDYQFVPADGPYSFKTIGRMIGNAVPVRLGEIVGKTIQKHLVEYAR